MNVNTLLWQLKYKMNVNIIFETGTKYSLVVLSQVNLKKQLLAYSKSINGYKQNIVFLYDGSEVEETDTISSLGVKNNDLFDVLFRTDKSKSSPSLVKHLIEEGFDLNKGVFYGKNIWCAKI